MSKKRLTKMNTGELAEVTSEFDEEFAADKFGGPDKAARGERDRANMLEHNQVLEAQMGGENRAIDIPGLMDALSLQRPIFHSEADFQHAFAWLLHARAPEAAIRLERPFEVSGQKMHVDLLVRQGGCNITIELKYKTRALATSIGDERYDLASHYAWNEGRYDFLSDIERIQDLGSIPDRTTGYAILLTNESAYWKPPKTDNTADADFRIHEGRRLQGSLAWNPPASARTKKSRKNPIVLLDTYVMTWRNYSIPCSHAYGQFRWLLAHIGPNRQKVAR